MPTTFSDAPDEVLQLLQQVMADYHQPLADAGVRVGTIMAYNDDGPAIKHAGYAAAATIKIVSLKDRLKKHYDAELLIDDTVWKELTHDQRLALLDHELSHVNLKKYVYHEIRDSSGQLTGEKRISYKDDDIGRPKLVTVPGDVNAGDGFQAVIRRHGSSALEYRNAMQLNSWARSGHNLYLEDLNAELGHQHTIPFDQATGS